MLDRLMAICATTLACALAIYLAVQLIESVAAALEIIAAVIGGLVITAVLLSLLWRRRRMDRW